ncbi:MAG: HAMP domain-containing sensor histidine kinase, partial [Chloroflexota bacterium]|nr:HAMP domain-containing sensor histidine kinase [Chloroflexota bacterium]
QELEKQYNERTEFINSLIHEVKTPLTAMLASSELLREELSTDSSILSDLAENLDVATHNLDRRISELVDFVKFQSTETRLNLQPVDFQRIAQSAASHVTGMLRFKHQTLELELPPSPGQVQADPDRLLQVLLNLLTNASKFSNPYTTICLRAYPADAEFIVELCDSAPPIDPEEAERIFTPYRRSGRKGSGGLGLGLFICKRLVQLQGGRIWLETDSAGNRFKFSLPLASTVGGGI